MRHELWLACEATFFHDQTYPHPLRHRVSQQLRLESLVPQWASKKGTIDRFVYRAMISWRRYHVHDTGASARVKQPCSLRDHRFLHADAVNLAAFLWHLREGHPDAYRAIVETVRLVAPFFGDFVLEPQPRQPDHLMLEWREHGADGSVGPDALSGGTLRFICSATLFLQPAAYLPATMIIDEPE